MKNSLQKILLIDDSEADNFLNARIIKKAGITEEIVIKTDAQQALDYLVKAVGGAFPKPDVIFLDINMPGMNGWEFLAAYQELEEKYQAGIIICMLTTSLAKEDREKAKEFDLARGFTNKPLTLEKLKKVLLPHHPALFTD